MTELLLVYFSALSQCHRVDEYSTKFPYVKLQILFNILTLLNYSNHLKFVPVLLTTQ